MEKESVINSTRFDFISGLNGKNVNGYYQIIGEKKETTCKLCSDMEGKIFHMSQKKQGINFPPFHPNCNSSVNLILQKIIEIKFIFRRRRSEAYPKGTAIDDNELEMNFSLLDL